MARVWVKHKVEDYGKWKAKFDEFAEMRKNGGETSAQVFTAVDDPNNVAVFCEFESEEAAKSFLASDELKTGMQQCGVIEEPVISVQ